MATLHNRRTYTCFQEVLGGREGPLMAEIYIFCFPIFFPNMSGISGLHVFICTCLVFSSHRFILSSKMVLHVGELHN